MWIHINKKKLKWIWGSVGLAAIVCMAIVFGGNLTGSLLPQETTQVSAGNWGLSFQEEGATPVGNATAESLAKNNAYFCGDSKVKKLYLTFDAGYENGYTEGILDVLKEEKVPAAFFVVGTYIKDNPELIKRMEKEGHIVGNHTMSHPDMSAIENIAVFQKELEDVESIYKEITGKKMLKYYRPPQGKFSEENLANAKKLGYTTVFWSLAYVDWYVDKQPSEEEAFSKLLPRTHNGAVILLHSTSKTNARILKKLITSWKEEGYQFCSLEELGKM